MLTILLAHIIITAVCFWSGFLFYEFFQDSKSQKPLIYFLIAGLILLTAFTQMLILFLPLTPLTHIIIGTLLLISALVKRKQCVKIFSNLFDELKELTIIQKLLLLFLWIIISKISAGPILMDDSESYHIQLIKWIREYGSVPGLVNLHERYGFNSSWFSSVALFSFSPETTGGHTVLNSTLSLWFCIGLISKFNKFAKTPDRIYSLATLIVLAYCLIIWPLIRGNAATTNYDFITTLIIFILLSNTFFSDNKLSAWRIEWIIFPAYLFTVRIINYPFLILSFFVFVYMIRKTDLKQTLSIIGFCLLLIIPFLVRNVIVAGSPFYPAPYFDIFNNDWKPDPQKTNELLEFIKYYNRVPTTYLDIEQTKALGGAWVPSWFHYLFFYDKLLIISGIFGLLLNFISLVARKSFYSQKRLFLLAVCVVSSVCWFIISPDPRFIYGVLLFGIFSLFYHITSNIKSQKIEKYVPALMLAMLSLGSGVYLFLKILNKENNMNWLIPENLPLPPVKEITIDNIKFIIPEPVNNNWNSRCYGLPLPCIYEPDPHLRARGKSLKEGFRLEKRHE